MGDHLIVQMTGNYTVECVKSSPHSEDCQLCNKIKQRGIDAWIERHQSYCIMCKEKPVCYMCLKRECDKWCKDTAFIEEYGTHRGCIHHTLNNYCEDFYCKYGFVGWWNPRWKIRFKRKKDEAGLAIKLSKRKEIKKKRTKEAEKKKKNLQRSKKNGTVKTTQKASPSARVKTKRKRKAIRSL